MKARMVAGSRRNSRRRVKDSGEEEEEEEGERWCMGEVVVMWGVTTMLEKIRTAGVLLLESCDLYCGL